MASSHNLAEVFLDIPLLEIIVFGMGRGPGRGEFDWWIRGSLWIRDVPLHFRRIISCRRVILLSYLGCRCDCFELDIMFCVVKRCTLGKILVLTELWGLWTLQLPPFGSTCPAVSVGDPGWPYDWNWTTEGVPTEVVQNECPYGQNGTAYWRCGEDGDWEGYPDLSDCRS